FFPDQLIPEARRDIRQLLEQRGVQPIMPTPEETKLGGVESLADARKCADLFHRHRDAIDGVLVMLPNFGDEKGVTETLILSKLDVPILIQAYPDDLGQLDPARRRDAFCGKISVCNNLVQAGIRFTLTSQHVCDPSDPRFGSDFDQFLGVCRVVNGLRDVRLGAVGARPAAFNTVRYSEKILQRHGIHVTTADLSEFLPQMAKLDNTNRRVQDKLESIQEYAPAPGVPVEKLIRMAKLGVVLDDWIEVHALDATAIQCWNSIQQNIGCNVCTLMSMMSEQGVPSACEVDVTGALTMVAMQLAAGSPAALADWNNNFGNDENKCVLFHCGNWAKSFLPDIQITSAPILGSTMGVENTYGALEGRARANSLTYGRITTSDDAGCIRTYVGEGQLTDDALDTFGARAVAQVPNLQKLMRHICLQGFEHHVAMTRSRTAGVLSEAFGNYLGWETYVHS
ncbi:MAG: hypothetical protein JW829_21440, partial [Pirellulales bacterium]|nr:hypothetical protein [Pirellulales bacterium]